MPLIAGTGRRLTRLDGFLFGVAAGVGFAIVEGILNGTLALRMSGAWAGLMVFRGSAAAMHCLASGLVGLGWQAILVERRWLAWDRVGPASRVVTRRVEHERGDHQLELAAGGGDGQAR